MKKEWIRNLIALVILAGLVGYVSWRRKSNFETSEKEEKDKKPISFDVSSVAKIEVSNATDRVVFERREKDGKGNYTDKWAPFSLEFEKVSEWLIKEPMLALPDEYSVSTLLDNLKDVSITKIVDENGRNPKEYNLETAPLIVRLFEKGQTAPKLEVKVGDANSASNGLYLKTSSSPQIILTSMTLEYLKKRKVADWRTKEIVGIKEVSKVTRLDAEYVDGAKKTGLRLAHRDEGWETDLPDKLPLDTKSVEGFLGDIKSLRATEIVSDNAEKDAAKYGLDRPYAKIHFAFSSETGPQEREVWIGGKVEKDKPIFVKRKDFPQVFSCSNALKNTLTKKIEDLVIKKPLAIAENMVTRMILQDGDNTRELTKEGEVWKLVKPVADVADPSGVKGLVNYLSEWKAKKYLTQAQDKPQGKPSAKITLFAGNQKRELTLFESADKKTVKGVRSDPTMVFEFERTDYDQFRTKTSTLREVRVMPFESEDFASVRVQKGAIEFSMARDEKGRWKAGDAKGVKPTKSTMDDLARAIESVKLTDFLDREKAADKKDSVLKVEVKSKKGEIQTWEFSPPAEGKQTAWSKARGIVGQVKPDDVSAIDKIFVDETKSNKKG